MNVILTGATGWLGSAILSQLAQLDCIEKIIAFSGKTDIEKLDKIDKIIFFKPTEVNTRLAFEKAKSDCTVIHCATVYDRNDQDAMQSFLCNEVFAIKILDAGAKSNIQSFINIDSFFTKAADDATSMMSYIISKDNFKKWGKVYSEKHGVKFINASIFHVYGKNDDDKKFLPWVLNKLANNETIVLQNPNSRRDFVFKEDAVEAIKKILLSQNKINESYSQFDIGCGYLNSVLEVVQILKKELNSKSHIEYDADSEPNDTYFEIKAQIEPMAKLGWYPRYSVRKGLKKWCDE